MEKTFCSPIQEILTTYDIGLHDSSFVIKILNGSIVDPINQDSINNWIGGTDYTMVLVNTLAPGDRILGVLGRIEQNLYSNYTQMDDQSVAFAFTYNILTVREKNCVYSNKSITLNNKYVYVPNQNIYIYNGLDFLWKNMYDVTTDDSLVTWQGTLEPITLIDYDMCVDGLYWNVQVQNITSQRVGIVNGTNIDFVMALNPDIGWDEITIN